jgi:hypothetical protein
VQNTASATGKGAELDVAEKERLKAYGFLAAFAAVFITFGYSVGRNMDEVLVPVGVPRAPLVAGAMLASLALLAPMVSTYRPSAAPKVLSALRVRARKTGRNVTLQSVTRTASLSVAALANTPILFGVMLQFLVGDFQVLVYMLPVSLVLAVAGWFILGRFFPALHNGFVR